MNLHHTASLILCLFLASCKIGQITGDFKTIRQEAQKIASDIQSVRGAIVPVDTLMMDVASGLLAGLSDAKAEERMDTITARLNRILVRYLNETFQNLDPGPVTGKAVQGAIDPLLATETEARIKEILASISLQISRDLSNILSELTSPANKAKLNSMLQSLLSEENSDAVAAFINRTLQDIRLDTLGRHIADDLIAAKLKPELEEITRTAVRAIFEEIQNDPNRKKVFSDIKDILFLALGLLGVILGLFFWWNNRKINNVNKMLINAIEDLDEKTGKDVKKVVERKARNEGLLRDLDHILKREHLLGKRDL